MHLCAQSSGKTYEEYVVVWAEEGDGASGFNDEDSSAQEDVLYIGCSGPQVRILALLTSCLPSLIEPFADCVCVCVPDHAIDTYAFAYSLLNSSARFSRST